MPASIRRINVNTSLGKGWAARVYGDMAVPGAIELRAGGGATDRPTFVCYQKVATQRGMAR
jgi:hypothetical protein